MAITFVQERKKQRYLILVLASVIILILLVVWWGFSKKEEFQSPTLVLPVFSPPKVEIDWQVLKDPQLEEFQLPEEIPHFEGEIGRENPFMPY